LRLEKSGGEYFVSKRVRIFPNILATACFVSSISLASISLPQAAMAQTESTSNSDRSALDALTWRGASSANTPQAYQAYLNAFPEGLFADLASQKLQELQPASAPTPAPVLVAQPASSPAPVVNSLTSDASQESATVVESLPENDPGTVEAAAPLEAERAYVAPDPPKKPLPTMPSTPQLAKDGYPECRENYKTPASPFDKIDAINRCTIMIDVYYEDTLNVYRERMIEHQNEISDIYTTQVANKVEYAGKRHNAFYDAMMKEHAASNPDGDHLAFYREKDAQYKKDRAYLEDRYCFNAGCNGYTAPDFDYALNNKDEGSDSGSKKSKKKKKKSGGKKKCRAASAGGGLLGGLIGGLGAKALGLGKIGQLIAGGAGALLGSKLACQLSKKEQEVAAEATVEIVEKEEVGATASWTSPERKGVSGSSTITALDAKPNGSTCLDITDVAIIDGEETSISKRMCRLAGQSRFTVMA